MTTMINDCISPVSFITSATEFKLLLRTWLELLPPDVGNEESAQEDAAEPNLLEESGVIVWLSSCSLYLLMEIWQGNLHCFLFYV